MSENKSTNPFEFGPWGLSGAEFETAAIPRSMMDPADQYPHMHFAQHARRNRILKLVGLLVSMMLVSMATVIQSIHSKVRKPYHTSVLTGEGWLVELLTGHPERIRCELGMHREIFVKLVKTLRRMGHSNSKYFLKIIRCYCRLSRDPDLCPLKNKQPYFFIVLSQA